MLSLTEADDGRTVEAGVGDTIRVSLPENAGGGYRWDIERVDGAIEKAGSQPHYPSDAVGSGGMMTFVFMAKKAGSGEIVLKNWRSFEGDASVQQRFRVRVRVKPG
jgi:inhibitor of cysteine peptidase